MTVEDLQKKVAAAEEKVEKCKKTIERHQVQMEKKAAALRKMGIDPGSADKYDLAQNNREAYWLLSDYDGKKDDIKGAIQKLEDAERVCANWKERLDAQINKEKIINDTIPQIIKDFLEDWKGLALEWYCQRYEEFLVFREDLRVDERAARLEALATLPELERERETCAKIFGDKEPDDSFLANLWPRKPVEAFLKERRLDYQSINERLNNFGDKLIFKMLEYRDEGQRLAFLEAALEAEKKRKLLFMIDSITSITGPITDAKHLYVSAGDLNGIIFGEKGVAKMQTFSAGGWNIQCFHYRTRVDDVTEKYKDDPAFIASNERICTYQFPRFEGGDDAVARDYGLEVLATTGTDTIVKGQYRDILAFADQYLGYQLVPEYLKDVADDRPALDDVINDCAGRVKKDPEVLDRNNDLEK